MFVQLYSNPDRVVYRFDSRGILCLLPDLSGGLLQAGVALLVCASGSETDADEGGPRSALEKED